MVDSSSGVSGRHVTLIIAILAILVGGYFAAQQLLQPPTKPSLDEGRAAADSFLNSVRDGKAGEAWDASTTEFKSIEGRESFLRKVKSTAILREPLQFASVQNVMIQDSPRSEFLYTSQKSGGAVRVLIGHEQGSWKVDRLTF